MLLHLFIILAIVIMLLFILLNARVPCTRVRAKRCPKPALACVRRVECWAQLGAVDRQRESPRRLKAYSTSRSLTLCYTEHIVGVVGC